MSYRSLLRTESATLAYCVAFTFGSSVGQTFFVSLFMPAVAAAVQTSHTRLATLYSIATVSSAIALPWLGRLIDRADILKYGLFAASGALAGCLLMSSAWNEWVVLAAMCLLRVFGLGLMSHVGWTGAGRYFTANRGKALSVVGLGHSAERRFVLLRIPAFRAYLPLVLMGPLALTALLFFQGLIAQTKGLGLEIFAAGFVAFAVV